MQRIVVLRLAGPPRHAWAALLALALGLPHSAWAEPPPGTPNERGSPAALPSHAPRGPGPGDSAPPASQDLFALPPWDWHDQCRADWELYKDDTRHFYSWPRVGGLALGLAAAAPLANTPADRSVQSWYQGRFRGPAADAASTTVSYAGQLWVVVPVGVEAAVYLGKRVEDAEDPSRLYEWSNRSLRAAAVGYPPALALFVLLGSSRPDRDDSRWHPFEDVHGVSGHTFIGAVPFLTAAAMTDNPWCRGPLVAGSFLTGWSRLHDDRHYLSQTLLGWWLAYLAVRSVDDTQDDRKPYSLVPTISPENSGVLLQLSY